MHIYRMLTKRDDLNIVIAYIVMYIPYDKTFHVVT